MYTQRTLRGQLLYCVGRSPSRRWCVTPEWTFVVAILIDPGEDAPLVVQTITEKGLKISWVLSL